LPVFGQKRGKSRGGGESVRQRSGKAAIVQHVHLTFSAASPPKPISQRPAGERNALLLGKRGSQTTGRIKIQGTLQSMTYVVKRSRLRYLESSKMYIYCISTQLCEIDQLKKTKVNFANLAK